MSASKGTPGIEAPAKVEIKAMDTDGNKEEFIYTPDEDFEELQDDDYTVEICGYVDNIVASHQVGKDKFWIFKFILNNGSSKRIQCVMWGRKMIDEYEPMITTMTKIRIQLDHSKFVPSSYRRNCDEKLVPFEVIIQKTAKVTLDEVLHTDTGIDRNPQVPVKIDFKNFRAHEDLVVLSGYLKTEFTKASTKNDDATWGWGTITDGQWKVSLNIQRFEPSTIELGTWITVTGNIQKNKAVATIKVSDMNCVIPDLTVPKMPLAVLSRGVQNPKRPSSQ